MGKKTNGKGVPSKGTPKDRRLKRNRPAPSKPKS